MPFALIVAVPLAALLLWALYSEQPPPRPVTARPGDWTGLPTPYDIRRHDFPLSVMGYDRGAIDDHLARVADAMAALLDERDGQVAQVAASSVAEVILDSVPSEDSEAEDSEAGDPSVEVSPVVVLPAEVPPAEDRPSDDEGSHAWTPPSGA